MRTLLVLTAIVPIAICSADATPIQCRMSNPLTCSNTSDLSWSPGFAAAITRFFGNRRASVFQYNRTLSKQAQYGLGGPPDVRKALGGDLFLFAACPPHDCGGQAAAIVVSDHGAIEGVGFSSFHCAAKCDFDHRHLEFYVHRGPKADAVVSALTDWGRGPGVVAMLQNPTVDDDLAARTSVELLQ
jgi:hypothetical protein